VSINDRDVPLNENSIVFGIQPEVSNSDSKGSDRRWSGAINDEMISLLHFKFYIKNVLNKFIYCN
jgi:hypothetical protein